MTITPSFQSTAELVAAIERGERVVVNATKERHEETNAKRVIAEISPNRYAMVSLRDGQVIQAFNLGSTDRYVLAYRTLKTLTKEVIKVGGKAIHAKKRVEGELDGEWFCAYIKWNINRDGECTASPWIIVEGNNGGVGQYPVQGGLFESLRRIIQEKKEKVA